MEPQEARTGTMVRVKEGYRKTDLVGMRGTVQKCWGIRITRPWTYGWRTGARSCYGFIS
jgi:hypothetical protein